MPASFFVCAPMLKARTQPAQRRSVTGKSDVVRAFR